MMKNSDEAIEQVLAGLREAEAPEGMERRILKAVHDGALARRKWNPMRLVMPSRLIGTPSWAIAVAGLAVVSLAIGWDGFRQHRTAHDIAGSNNHMVPANVPGPQVKVAVESGVMPLHRSSIARVRGKTNLRSARIVRDSDSVAVDEMRAASHPPPPLPLTEQERLLLRIVHKGAPEELAALNPAQRAARDAEEKAEVQRFFVPTPTGDNE